MILSEERINTDDTLNRSPFKWIDDALGVFVDDGRRGDEIGIDILDADILFRHHNEFIGVANNGGWREFLDEAVFYRFPGRRREMGVGDK